VSKVVKSVGRAVGKVVKGVKKAVSSAWKKIKSSKVLRVVAMSAAVYFGGAALMGGFSSAAGGGSFLSGMSGGFSNAVSGISGAFSSALGGNFGQAGSQLMGGFTGSGVAGAANAGVAAPGWANSVAGWGGNAGFNTAGITPPGATPPPVISSGGAPAPTGSPSAPVQPSGPPTSNVPAGSEPLGNRVPSMSAGNSPVTPTPPSPPLQAAGNGVPVTDLSGTIDAAGLSGTQAGASQAGGGILNWVQKNPMLAYGGTQLAGSAIQGYGAQQQQEEAYEREDDALRRYNENATQRIGQIVRNPSTGLYEVVTGTGLASPRGRQALHQGR